LFSRLYRRYYLSRNGLDTRDLDTFPQLSTDQQRLIVGERLLSTIRYFGNRADGLPEWKQAARIQSGEEALRIWPNLPPVTKGLLRERFVPEEIERRFRLQGQVASTGGSTGEPTRFFHDTQTLLANVALADWTARKMGWSPGMAMAIIWGSERDIGKDLPAAVKRFYQLSRQVLLDGYEMTDDTARRLVELIRSKGPIAIYGFSSMLEEMARRVIANGWQTPTGLVRTAWNGGEMLYPNQIELFQRAFGSTILNRYGSREASSIACQWQPFSALRISMPWYFVEIVDDHYKPVAPGEGGRILLTNTICRGTPFIRYEIEDLGTAAIPAEGKDDGITRDIQNLEGRLAGLLTLRGGKRVSNLYWNHLFKEFSEVEQFQIIQRLDGSLKILLRGAGFTTDREAMLQSTVEKFLNGVNCEWTWVKEIPRTARGKLVQVVLESTKK